MAGTLQKLIFVFTEAAAGGALLRNLQENTFNRVSFLIKFIKKETLAQVFSCEFCEIFKNTVFTEHLWATASVFRVFLRKVSEQLFHGIPRSLCSQHLLIQSQQWKYQNNV